MAFLLPKKRCYGKKYNGPTTFAPELRNAFRNTRYKNKDGKWEKIEVIKAEMVKASVTLHNCAEQSDELYSEIYGPWAKMTTCYWRKDLDDGLWHHSVCVETYDGYQWYFDGKKWGEPEPRFSKH